MFKIVYLVSTLEARAPVRQLFYIIKYLDRKKFKPFIVTLSPEKDKSYKHLFLEIGVEIRSLNLSRFRGFFLNGFLLDRIFNEIKPDIVHSSGFRADTLLKKFKNHKRISTLRANPYKDYLFSYGRFLGDILASKELDAILSFDKVVCVSKSLADIIYEKRGVRVDYIYNGLDLEIFDSFSKSKKELRKSLNLPQNKKIFIVIGNLIEGKDPQTILSAFEKLNRKDLFLLFLGEGDLLRKCKDMGKDFAEFRGFVSNVIEYLYASDYLISASLSEGMPNSVLEAMASGLGVVLSDIPPHREIVKDKEFAELFQVKNPLSLKEKVLKILEKEREQISKAARERVKEDFEAKNNSLKYQKLYEDLMKG